MEQPKAILKAIYIFYLPFTERLDAISSSLVFLFTFLRYVRVRSLATDSVEQLPVLLVSAI